MVVLGFGPEFITSIDTGATMTSGKTSFRRSGKSIGVLSLVQIIYLTEVGTIAIKSEVPLNFWRLLMIFLERTVLAIPRIVLFANIVL